MGFRTLVDNLIAFNCFDVVPHTDAVKYGRLVKSKWVFKVKYDRDNNPYRFRARLVAKGFSQKPGLDFDQTYSPVMAYPSLRALLAMAAANDYMMTGFDVKNAFIQQRLVFFHTCTWQRRPAYRVGRRPLMGKEQRCIASEASTD